MEKCVYENVENFSFVSKNKIASVLVVRKDTVFWANIWSLGLF